MQLYPQILFRTDADASPAAAALRCAGYVVTKVRSDDDAERLVRGSHVEAMVIELSLAQAISTARRETLAEVPKLFLTAAPARLWGVAGAVATLHPHDVEDDLVSKVDLLIASNRS
jgi:hypothetical protein